MMVVDDGVIDVDDIVFDDDADNADVDVDADVHVDDDVDDADVDVDAVDDADNDDGNDGGWVVGE